MAILHKGSMNAALITHLNSASDALLTRSNSALELPGIEDGSIPEWIHLLPAGPQIETRDDFGPFPVGDLDALIARSFSETSKLAVDVNHAIDTGAPKGEPSPAVGWITEMQAREDGFEPSRISKRWSLLTDNHRPSQT